MIQRLALFAVVLLSGCQLYWGGGDDVCNGRGVEVLPAQQFRNPQTGVCEAFGGGGGGCNSACGPCPQAGAPGGSGTAVPDWGACYGSCEALGETACLAAASCHAAYWDNPVPNGGHKFWTCWEIPPSGAIHSGSCAGLDAQTCSEHTDCISNMNSAKYTAGTQEFQSCAPEPTTNACDLADICSPGTHCEQQCSLNSCHPMCIPDTTCANVNCGPGYTCLETCTTMSGTTPGSCYPQCVPTTNDPGSCTGAITCTTLPPACPTNTTAGRANGCYTGYCIPNTDCGPHDPGTCTGQVNCLTGQPACPTGTVAGIKNGCWSGYCIPINSCPAPPCAGVATEASCKTRSDCIPVYDGMNCTCYPDHCVCEIETYARCESAVMPL